ncbi:AAA family ATPase [Methanosarcina sp. UBA5]|uniref:AAA family ATPase n=1 Tax=Methanosarcina sp. UBA5 TaxID=1915593 RepID=UPI0025FD3E57|nr:ATP-binding protein [Methanosarcina sp. UBA5]
MKPYDNNLEHLLDELSRMDLLLRTYLEKWLEDSPEVGGEFRGLYVSETEIGRIRRSSGFGNTQGILQESQIERLREVNALRRKIDARIEESLKRGRELRLQKISELFGLDPFEIDILLIGLAPELDLKYEKLYSYLQNDVMKKKPTVDLALTLLFPTTEEKIKARIYFSSFSSLRKNNLVYLLEREENADSSLISSFIKIDERIINFLLEFDEPDLRIRDFSYVIKPANSFENLILPPDFKNKLVNIASWYNRNKLPPKLLFCGPHGSGKKSVAEAICREAGVNLLIVDSKVLLEGRSIDTAHFIMREALLQNSAIYFQAFDVLFEDKESKSYPESLIQALNMFSGPIFLAGKESLEFDKSLMNNGFISCFFSLPSYMVRKQLWETCLKGGSLAKEMNLDALASKFRFSGGQIKDAVRIAFSFAGENNPSCMALSMEDLYKSCKIQSNQNLSSLALKTNSHYTWEDIVLPKDTLNHLKEVSGFIKYKGKVHSDWGFEKKLSLGKGLNVLFSGPPGTGKTMAAEILANEVKLDLYKIDLSSLVSKYIGETEKNLKKIFDEAETSNSILFFDEADALFGKRSEVKDSHDRYANIETAYLLQKMEGHEGIVILASNFRKNMDDAFLRRLHFIIEFPLPDEKLRENIWQKTFPKETPTANDVDFAFLSKFKLSGGNIKNVVLAASFLAAEHSKAVEMEHLIKALRREYEKIGKLFTEADFGEYYKLCK